MASFAKPPCDAGVIRATPHVAPAEAQAAPWILAATILGSGMVFVDGTVVNVALPALQRDLGATLAEVQWVIESFALFLAALLLAAGAAGDRFGRRRVFSLGTIIFALASVWCGIARNPLELIIARALQGIGGALLVPNSLAIISASFDDRERGKAIGTWSGATAITAAIGPVLGGWLIDEVSWRAVFFLNIPLAAAVLAIAWWHVPESRNDEEHGGLDWPGAALATLGLGGLVYGLIEAPQRGWESPDIVATLAFGVLALVAFVYAEKRHRSPMLPLRLFRLRTFSGANLLTFFLYGALGGGLFFVPLNLIQVQGYSATAAGAALLPFILLVFLLSRWAGGLVDTYGNRLPLVVGPLIAGLGYALFAVPSVGGSYWTTFFPGAFVLGLGMAVSVAPLTTTVMSSVESAFAGTASGINNAASRVAALLAVALFGAIMTPVFNFSLDRALAGLSLPPSVLEVIQAQRDKLAAIELPVQLDAAARSLASEAIANAFVSGFRWIMAISALCCVASAMVAWLMIDGGKPARSGKSDKASRPR
ncbi:MAG: MFS transporter [Bradyrhizobiaceae bacterium]|nr:MFS transporter [Bradyrhizobiaceae bacterium]